MSITIDGGAGITFPDTVQQTNATTNTGGAPRYYAARAWVNFNGSGTVAIRAASNVASITDNGTGDYTINFSVAMPDANYVLVGNCDQGTDFGRVVVTIISLTSSSARIRCSSTTTASTGIDCSTVSVAVFR